MIPMRYSEARGTLIYEKNLKSKISCQTPFKAPSDCETSHIYEKFRFFNCPHALPDAMVVLIADLVEAVLLPSNPYMELRYLL